MNLKEMLIERNTTHGMSKHPVYSNWKDMFKRCYNPNNKRYEHYHSKGIGVHESFKWFPTFLEEIGEKPDNEHVWTVGRIDNNKSYEPGNIRWETREEQSRNHSLQKNNTSGVVGVKFRSRMVGEYGPYQTFTASWKDENGKGKSKEFSVDKFGYEEAKQMAINYRNDRILELKEKGIEYAESHGK